MARLLVGCGDDVALGGVMDWRVGEWLRLGVTWGCRSLWEDPERGEIPDAGAEAVDADGGTEDVGAAAVVVAGAVVTGGFARMFNTLALPTARKALWCLQR